MILSTIHSAKGQEWAKVFVLNTVDGCIPIDLAVGEKHEIDEERRLLYVAMTRAKDGLHLITPQRFYTSGQASRGDRHVYASRTRFVPAHILDYVVAGSQRCAVQIAPSRRSRRFEIENARHVAVAPVQGPFWNRLSVSQIFLIDMVGA